VHCMVHHIVIDYQQHELEALNAACQTW
jgi:hypothetical protein